MKNQNEQQIGCGMNFMEKQRLIKSVSEGNGEYKQIAKMLNGDVQGDKIILNKFRESNLQNSFALATLGKGRAYHPWADLKSCECGGSAWMEGKNGGDFEEGGPYSIRCCKCGRHTQNGDIQDIKNEWNNVLAEKKLEIVVIDPESEYEELAKMLGGKVIHITSKNSNPGYFNPLELCEAHITNEDIINIIENIIKIRKMLNTSNRDEPKDVLESVCLKNNLKLSDEYKAEILRAIQDKPSN